MRDNDRIRKMLRRIKSLRQRRNAEIAEVRANYQPTLKSLCECLAKERAKGGPKIRAIDKYRESQNALPRTCKGCGDELLLATEENARRVEINVLDERPETPSHDFDVHWATLRRMHSEFCCWGCKNQMGWHSRWCYSRAKTQAREMPEETPEEETKTSFPVQ